MDYTSFFFMKLFMIPYISYIWFAMWREQISAQYVHCRILYCSHLSRTLHVVQWTWFVAWSQEGSFHVSATSRGLQGPRFKHLRFFFFCGDIWSHVSIPTVPSHWPMWRRQSSMAAFDREILDRAYTAFQQRLESCIKAHGHHCLTLFFTDNMHFKWH
jgi:hypothetical protein